MKLKIGIALSVVVLVGCIIGFALPWYQIQRIDYGLFGKDKTVTVQYKWKEFTCQIEDEDKYTGKFEDDESTNTVGDNVNLGLCLLAANIWSFDMTDVAKTLNACLSFLIIGAALALGTTLLQIILLVSPKLCRSCIWKVLTIGCSMATIAMLFVSFFTLFSIPKSFDEDTLAGSNVDVCGDRWCDKIIGNDDSYKWIPGGGWWATLAACFTSLVAGIFTLVSHR